MFLNRATSSRAGVTGLVCFLAAITASHKATAFSFEFGEFSGSLNSAISIGATFSTEAPDKDLIGKLNIDGQQDICDQGQSIDIIVPGAGLLGIPDPLGACALSNFGTFFNAQGSFIGAAFDDNRQNYDKGDLVAAAAKLSSDLFVKYDRFALVARLIVVSDPVNTNFTEKHVNNFSNGGAQPARTPREKEAEEEAYQIAQLETAYFEATAEAFNRFQVFLSGNHN